MEILELEEGKSTDDRSNDALALFNGSTPVVQRLNGASGEVKWTFEDNR